MDRFILIGLGLLGFVVLAGAQVDPLPDKPKDLEPHGAEDRLAFIQTLFGDISDLPDWFQQLVQRKIDSIEEREAEKPRGGRRGGRPRPRPGRRGGLLRLSEEDMEGIEIPDWFTEFIEYLESKKRDSPRGPPSEKPAIEFADDVPEWFQTWFTELADKLHANRPPRRFHGRPRPPTRA